MDGSMRLLTEEVDGIIKALDGFVAIYGGELRLYGSRVDDKKKGGDIDLLLILPDASACDAVKWQKADILVAIKGIIGEQKIDLKIIDKTEIATDEFVALIWPQSIVLHKWGK
jgi:uncharacterized protein